MQIYESAEDYLESILKIQEEKGVVHSLTLPKKKDFPKPVLVLQ